MLEKGSSQPWQDTLKELTGSDHADAAPVLEYFAPLQAWLKQQNEGKTCGWQVPAATITTAPRTPAGEG
jgi:peptidyl-dipeptidase A